MRLKPRRLGRRNRKFIYKKKRRVKNFVWSRLNLHDASLTSDTASFYKCLMVMNAVHNVDTPVKAHNQDVSVQKKRYCCYMASHLIPSRTMLQSFGTSISNDSFHTPLRPNASTIIPAAPQSAYVDYTPRHLNPLSTPARGSHVHQSYMDSPIVRKQLGVNADVRHISPEPAIEQREREEDMLRLRKTDWCVDDFDVGQHIGSGKFGRAYIAMEKKSKHVVALKILQKDEIQTAQVFPFLKREIEIQGHLR